MNSAQVSQAQAYYGLFFTARSQWPNNVSTSATVGKGQTAVSLSNIAAGYDRTLSLTNSGATGTLVLATNVANGFSSTSGIDGKDFEGADLGTISNLKGILIRCLTGGANISGSTANVIDFSMTANAVELIFNESGLGNTVTAQTLSILSTAANTNVQVTVQGA